MAASLPTTWRQPLGDDRVFLDKTPPDLAEIFNANISVKAEKLIEPFIGKWMKVWGSISNISRYKDGSCFVYIRYLNKPEDAWSKMTMAVLEFDARWNDRLSILDGGENITAIGEIERIGYQEVKLIKCELV
jgi:hypothetical protein